MRVDRRGQNRFCALGVLLGICSIFALSCGNGNSRQPASSTASKDVGAALPQAPDSAKPLPSEYEVTDRVEIKTSEGSIVVGLYGKSAPRTVANFLGYVDRDFYSGKIFHRVIPGFMIQGGGFDPEMKRAETQPSIKLEIIPGLQHKPGVISMARTSDPHSATSQFFICVGEAPQLNGGYAAFGKVESGYEVVEKISNLPTKTADTEGGQMADVPTIPVVIEKVSRL